MINECLHVNNYFANTNLACRHRERQIIDLLNKSTLNSRRVSPPGNGNVEDCDVSRVLEYLASQRKV